MLKSVVEAHPESPAAFAIRKLVKEIREVLGDEEVRSEVARRDAR
jgi:hypothetical protein